MRRISVAGQQEGRQDRFIDDVSLLENSYDIETIG